MALKVIDNLYESKPKPKIQVVLPKPKAKVAVVTPPKPNVKLTVTNAQGQPIKYQQPQAKSMFAKTAQAATTTDLGQAVKRKYPGVYDDLPDEQVGSLVKAKYPGAYDDFTDPSEAGTVPVINNSNTLPSAKKSTSDKIGGVLGSVFGGDKIGDAVGTFVANSTMPKEIDYGGKVGKLAVPRAKGPSIKEIIGDVIVSSANIASAGVGSRVKAGIGVARTAQEAIKQGVKIGAKEGAAFGATFGAGQALKEDQDLPGFIRNVATGTVTGSVLSGTLGGIANKTTFNAPQKAAALKEKALEQYKLGLQATKEKYKQEADKAIPYLLEEKVYGTRRNLIKKAEKQLALSGEEYKELGELAGVTEINGIIGNIDKEISSLKSRSGYTFSTNRQKVKALEDLKDDIVALQVMKNVESPKAYQEDLRKLAQDYGSVLYETRKSLQTISDSSTLSQVRKVDASIRELLNAKNPNYAKINKVYSNYSKLYDILIETEQRKSAQNPLINLINVVATAGPVAAGVVSGNVPEGIGAALAMGSLAVIARSTWWNTARAVSKQKAAEKLLQMAAQERNRWLLYLERQGIKGLNELLGAG